MELDSVSFYTLETAVAQDEIPQFLYLLVPGRSKSSMGILCAANNGIQESVLDRAASISSALEKGQPIPLLNQNKDLEAKALAVLTHFLKMDLASESCDLDFLFRLLSIYEKCR